MAMAFPLRSAQASALGGKKKKGKPLQRGKDFPTPNRSRLTEKAQPKEQLTPATRAYRTESKTTLGGKGAKL
jgi:hypothetical protein